MKFTKRLRIVGTILSAYPPKDAGRLLLDYVRIVIKNRFVSRGAGSERLLSFTVAYPNRDMFFGVATELFFRRMYGLRKKETTLPKTELIVDCGANIGLSILYFAWEYPEAKIVCFEPNPEALLYLRKNVEQNRLPNVTIHPYALGRADGDVTFYVDRDAEGSSSASATRDHTFADNPKQKAITVPMRKLSGFITEPVDILKVDIEGEEGVVFEELESAGKLPLVRRMFIEYHFDNLHMTYPLGKFLSLFDRGGFRYSIFSPFSLPFSVTPPKMITYIVHVWKGEGTPHPGA